MALRTPFVRFTCVFCSDEAFPTPWENQSHMLREEFKDKYRDCYDKNETDLAKSRVCEDLEQGTGGQSHVWPHQAEAMAEARVGKGGWVWLPKGALVKL